MRIRDLAAALALLCGCTQIDVVAVPHDAIVPAPDARVMDARVDTDPPDARVRDARVVDLDASREDASSAPPPCTYGDASRGSVAQPALLIGNLTRAICSCDSITSSDALTTDGTAARGGDVGVNGVMSIETSSTLDGTLTVAGSGGLHLGDGVELGVGAALLVGGPLEGALATARVMQDASVSGRIDLASLFVTGTLTQPAGAERRITGTSQINAARASEVTVSAPCDCADAALFDTAAFVATEAPLAMPLPAMPSADAPRCSAYALPDGEVASVQIGLRRSAAIYVPGDLHITGDLIVDAEAGAEIDLFIAGDVRIDGNLRVGSAPGQGPVRIYVGGAGTVQLSTGGELHGALYAPKAELVLSAPLTLRGALFMRRVAASAALSVHYEASVAGE